jgi:ribosome-binding factor A
MSTPRNLRVSQAMKRELSEIIMRDLKDARIGGLVSITEVECTADCHSARVYVSVYGEEAQQLSTIEALNDRVGLIRGEIGRRLRLRLAPEISFRLDDSLERGARVTELIARISRGEV